MTQSIKTKDFLCFAKSVQTVKTKAAHLLFQTLFMSTKKSTNTLDINNSSISCELVSIYKSISSQCRILFVFYVLLIIATDSWQVDYSKAQKIASPNYTAGRLKPISVKYEDNKTKN
jgi:hypothetical protein